MQEQSKEKVLISLSSDEESGDEEGPKDANLTEREAQPPSFVRQELLDLENKGDQTPDEGDFGFEMTTFKDHGNPVAQAND